MSESGSSPASRTGGCQCGAVRFMVSGVPESVSICHCRMCQKASGGAFMALARFPSAAVSWTRGQPALFRSSTVVTRGFCPACGTPLLYQRRSEAVSLTTGAFDDPHDLVPTLRYGAEHILPWTDHLAELPAQTTEDWLTGMPEFRNRLRSHQHPDHET